MRPEDAIKALQTDHTRRSSHYDEGKAIWQRLFTRLKRSELGQTFPVNGTVDTQDYCANRGNVSCDIKINISGVELTIHPNITRKSGGSWSLKRYGYPKDEVTFSDENELDPLILEYIVHTSRKKTDSLVGSDEG